MSLGDVDQYSCSFLSHLKFSGQYSVKVLIYIIIIRIVIIITYCQSAV